ncbi:hypothetical protein BKN14_02650 [Candidatus Gracilibacteria bacterium HOT-871]|nr:hypothetical protein BKN14_02650 [Candidatus Gracilibacteria bacterium HOT-871]MBB1564864.1 FAD:protein FMN transferase [Candidatus Gracilibacteria bacterium]RKW21378.1 MAG: FAD:protein FMN transferase [Candidatus Gracilibacteria bacterium]
MKKYKKELLGTILEIAIFDDFVDDNDLENIFKLIKDFEEKYSRFKVGNYLWSLNKQKKAKIDDDFKAILNIAQKANELSKGHFDITILPFLENIGYGISNEKLEEKVGMENIFIENDEIILKNDVSIEIGGIGKGYMVDVIFNNLKEKYKNFVINFGGDIRILGEKREFLLEDPLDENKFIGKIKIENLALASSGSNKRKTKKGHHLIDAKTGKSKNDIIGVYVTHKLASFADTFATTLFVSPINISLEILENFSGLEAMIITKSGEIYKSKNFNFINQF